MFYNKRVVWILTVGIIGILSMLVLSLIRVEFDHIENGNDGSYHRLAKDTSAEDPLKYIQEDFLVTEGFHTNLPIVILTIDGEIPDYKNFENSQEVVFDGVDPYITGNMAVIDREKNDNFLTDTPSYFGQIKLKKRGHTSYSYDKLQYLVKTVKADGTDDSPNLLGMGEGDSWILNGSMADKSMIRNYLPYRIASEIDGNRMAPDSQFCEVLLKKDEGYEYQGVFLLMETVSRGSSRVNIDQYREKNIYSSYIVRRDRFTNFDVMLDTYGRLNGFSEQWIGVKYPSAAKLSDQTKQFIEKDFSKTEQILYAEDEATFKIYDKYININSFVDYFLINEYFGNYDAGEHSTYMYKNSGDLLNIGPVWDFDQAMNNYFLEEMNAETLAFQTKPLFIQLMNDKRFIEALKDRYSKLRNKALSEEHVFSVIDETIEYLKSARVREWYRWAADYEEGSFANNHNYYLQDYVVDNITISRFNDNYNQEIYNIKNYLHQHGQIIQTELSKMSKSAEFNSSLNNENELLLLIIMVLFLIPSFFINREG